MFLVDASASALGAGLFLVDPSASALGAGLFLVDTPATVGASFFLTSVVVLVDTLAPNRSVSAAFLFCFFVAAGLLEFEPSAALLRFLLALFFTNLCSVHSPTYST